ncbi:MAG: hypothetical protein COB67_07495 [SAR324 cluster bacterium]|uniref:Uncharacterized protein n=1 Tax=SAR324 cluster bacterium TaxID=2024889 RepID=A0A2A4T2S1_9DELT|nr:MAG: hypothetical protein COB67_07495 [SAR324 cluster bacterium]
MTQSSDLVLQELVWKKQELVRQLLLASQKYALPQQEAAAEEILKSRAELIPFLELNDRCIEQREGEIGCLAKIQEKELYQDINFMIQAIADNNQIGILLLEEEKKVLTLEKKQLERGNKVSGYLKQQSSFKPMFSSKTSTAS